MKTLILKFFAGFALLLSVSNSFAASVITITGNNNAGTNNVSSGTLPYGTLGVVLYGFTASSTGTTSTTVTQFRFNATGQPISQFFTNFRLVKNTTTDYNTGTKTAVTATIATGGSSTLTISAISQVIATGTPVNYFIIADYNTVGNVLPQNEQLTFQDLNSNATSTSSVNTGGQTLTLASPILTISNSTTGVYTGSTIVGGSTYNLIGFNLSYTGPTNLHHIRFNITYPSGGLKLTNYVTGSNVKLYNAATNVAVTGVTYSVNDDYIDVLWGLAAQSGSTSYYLQVPFNSFSPNGPTALSICLSSASNSDGQGNCGNNSNCSVVNNYSNAISGTMCSQVFTPPTVPVVTTTTPVTEIYGGTGTVGGNITSTGGANVTEYGVVYSTSASTPTTANSKFVMGGSATGAITFSDPLQGLAPNTLYYVRAYAINSVGTSYGAVTSFTTVAAPNISYVTPQTYTVGTNIGSLSPTNTGGVVPARTFGAYTTFATNLSNYFMAFDGDGNLYEADATSVVKITPAGVKSTFATGFTANSPTGVAVDPSGNVYLSSTSNIIYKITPAGVVSTFISGGLSAPYGLVFDNAGNLYIANSGTNVIFKVAYGTTTLTTYATGFNQPYGLAIDETGKLYEADRSGNKIYSIVGGVKTQIGGTFTAPTGIAAAADGWLYFASLNTTDNIFVLPAGSTTATSILAGAPLSNPRNLTLDNTGEYLYISNTDAGTILKQSVTGYTYSGTLPAGLSFDYTTGAVTGIPTAPTVAAGNTITVTAYNSGGNDVTTLNIIVLPVAPTITGSATLCGAQTNTLTASGGLPAGGTYNWYSAATGGTAIVSTASFNTFTGGTTTFYVSYTPTGSATSARTAYTVTVNQEFSSSINSPMISWPFEAGSLTDWSVLGNNPVISTTATTVAPTLVTDRMGVTNSAYQFAGTAAAPSFIYSTTNYTQLPLVFSYSLWFKTTVGGGRLLGFSGTQNGNLPGTLNATHDRDLYMSNTGQIGFGIYNATAGSKSIATTTTYLDGLWHHVVVANGPTSGMIIYVDGISRATGTYFAPQLSAGYWRIGGDATGGYTASPTNNFYQGALDDIAIYNHEMTAAEATSNDVNLYKFSTGYCANNLLTVTAQNVPNTTYSWVDNATPSITATGITATFTNATTTNYTLTTTVNTCTQNTAVVTPNNLTFTWTGAVDGNFNGVGNGTTSNWINTSTNTLVQTPSLTGTESIIIPTGLTTYPTLGNNCSVYSLTIQNGATLTLNGKILSVGCNIINTAGGKILYGPGVAGSTAANTSAITWNGSGTVANQSYTGASTINTAQVGSMTVNNTVTNGLVTINSGAVDVYNALTMTSGKLAITSPAVLTLKSLAAQSAYTNALTTATSITGSVNVERYLTGGTSAYRSYRLLSSPVNISSSLTGIGSLGLSYINTTPTIPTGSTSYGALTAGPGGNSATTNFSVTNANPTMYLYNEALPSNNKTFTGGKAAGIIAVGNAVSTTPYAVSVLSNGITNANVNIPVGNGYFFYYIGNNQSTVTASTRIPDNTTITSIGYLNQGDVPVKLWSNSGSTSLSYTLAYGVNAGYNLVGNPYASTIDLSKVYTDNYNLVTNPISPNFYELNNQNPSQNYVTVNFTVPGTPVYSGTNNSRASRYVASGQGFFTKTTATGQTLTFKEGQKVTTQLNGGTNLILLESAPKADVLAGISIPSGTFNGKLNAALPVSAQLNGLHIQLYQDSILNDECGIYFSKAWTDNYDNNDAIDIDGVGPKIFMSSFTSDGQRTAINFLSDYSKGKRVKLFVKSATDGMRNLVLTNIENIDTVNYKITLIDHYKKDSLDIGRYKTYAFNVLNSDTTTFGGQRFELSIKPIPGPKYQLATFTAQKATDGVLVTWRALNEGNNYAYTLEKQDASGTGFAPVYQIQSNGGTIYKYTDKTPFTGNNVYRLKQVDLFGNITYTGPVNVYFDKSGNSSLFSLYPNPTVETINVNVTYGAPNTAASLSYKLKIYDITGSVVMQKTSDNSSFSQNVSKFNPGVYIVELRDNNGSSLGKAKFVKK